MELLKQPMQSKGGTGSSTFDSYNRSTDEDLIKKIQEATELYPSLRSLAYRMPGRRQSNGTYLSETEMSTILENLMDTSVAAAGGHLRHDDWVDRRRKISDLVRSAIEKEKRTYELTDLEISAMSQGESFIKTQEMIAASSRPIGAQRESTAQDIELLVAALTTVDPSSTLDTKSTGEFVRLNVEQLNATALPPIKWVVPRMIPEQGTISLAGMSNVGKTRWLAALIMGLAVGDTNRLGLPQCEERITTVWIANEERTEDICRRLKAVARQHGDKKSADIVIRGKGSGMLRLVAMNEVGNLEIDEQNVAIVVAEIRAAKARFVVFDPYVTLSDAADENSANSAAMITKAFLLITSRTGAALLHAHHTPKDRNKDNDWVRGDASAWRGSGAIYSALDCGFTLSNWMPKNGEQKKIWKTQYLTGKLSRFIVLDTGKIREGEALDPVLMELVPQEMAEGEGDPIGVCRLAVETEAANALLDVTIDIIAASVLANAMVERLGEGEHNVLATIHKLMNGVDGWPSGKRTQARHLEKMCSGVFTQRWVKAEGDYCVKFVPKAGKGTEAKWAIVIKKEEPEVE